MIRWEEGNHYGKVYAGYLGKWRIFDITVSVMRGKDMVLCCRLPGIKSELGDGSAEELKEKASKVLEHWLELAQLQEKERL